MARPAPVAPRLLAAALLAFAVLVPLRAPPHAQTPTPDPDQQVHAVGDPDKVWIIDTEVHCIDATIVEHRAILIYGTGHLILDGCRLVMDSPAYTNKWIGATNEGLVIHALLGGRIDLKASASNPASIVPADDRYGYRIDVDGAFASDGRADSPNLIRGLEGYMAESYVGGGLRVFGHGKAWLNQTVVRDIQGPALNVADGAHGWVSNVTVRNASGAFAVGNGTLTVADSDVNTGIEGIRSTGGQLTVLRSSVASDHAAIRAVGGTVTVADSLLHSPHNDIIAESADIDVTGTRLTYGVIAIVHKIKSGGTALPYHDVSVSNSTFRAFRPGNATASNVGLSTQAADVRIDGCTFNGHSAAGVSVIDSPLHVHGSTFNGTAATDIFSTDAPSWDIADNAYSASAAARPVRLPVVVDVTVRDGNGPVEGAKVAIAGGNSSTTAKDGSARVAWDPVLTPALALQTESVAVEVSKGHHSQTQSATLQQHQLVFTLPRSAPSPGPALLLLGLAALAAVLRRR